MRRRIVVTLGVILAAGAGCSRRSSLFLDPGRADPPAQAQPAAPPATPQATHQPPPACAPKGRPVPAGQKPCA